MRLWLRKIDSSDLDRLARMDEQLTGIRRADWYRKKTSETPADSYISIGAEVDGLLVGAILGSLREGEIGVPEPIAVLDAILVDRSYRGRGIATEMLRRLAESLRSFGIQRLRTELSWDEKHLNGVLTSRGFVASRRLVLDLDVRMPPAPPPRSGMAVS